MDKNANSLNWFEIPASDINRAKDFYENIFDIKMDAPAEMMGMQMVFFPSEPGSGKANGGIVQSSMHTPSQDGSVIYLNANPAMDNVLERINNSGGKILMPKTEIGQDFGYMAFFVDSEGNKMGLHSNS